MLTRNQKSSGSHFTQPDMGCEHLNYTLPMHCRAVYYDFIPRIQNRKIEMTAVIPYYFQVCHIPALDVLYLNQEEGKTLSSFPEAELEFMSVSELHMECNSLTGIPSLISTMPGIQKLFLNDNQIQTLPTELCELKHLQVLRKFLSTCVVISLHCDGHFIYFISQ